MTCTMASCGNCGMCTEPWEAEDDDRDECPDCLGSGEVVREDGTDIRVLAECLECHGQGWLSNA